MVTRAHVIYLALGLVGCALPAPEPEPLGEVAGELGLRPRVTLVAPCRVMRVDAVALVAGELHVDGCGLLSVRRVRVHTDAIAPTSFDDVAFTVLDDERIRVAVPEVSGLADVWLEGDRTIQRFWGPQ